MDRLNELDNKTLVGATSRLGMFGSELIERVTGLARASLREGRQKASINMSDETFGALGCAKSALNTPFPENSL